MSEPIHVRRHGTTGPLVVVLHGGPGAPGSALGLALMLATEARVLEPLQRASGEGELTVARHVDDLAQIAPVAAVVGWSWGAMLGLSYAARHPEKVESLVLVGCGTYSERERRLYRARLDAALGEAGRAPRDELTRALGEARESAERDRLLAALGSLFTEAEGVDTLPADDEPIRVDARGHEETWRDVLRLQSEGIEPASFARIRAPVLMVHGDHDPHPGTETAQTLGPYLPQLERIELARCGHEPWRERHARVELQRILLDWLRRHARGGRP